MHEMSCKNKSASGATKETCSNYQCDQFYLFIFFMNKAADNRGLMRESSLLFRPYLVCPLYLLALLTSQPNSLVSRELTKTT